MFVRREEFHEAFNAQPSDPPIKLFMKYWVASILADIINISTAFLIGRATRLGSREVIDVTLGGTNDVDDFPRRGV